MKKFLGWLIAFTSVMTFITLWCMIDAKLNGWLATVDGEWYHYFLSEHCLTILFLKYFWIWCCVVTALSAIPAFMMTKNFAESDG
ncbi:MAG: hypothetical protein WC761_05710 [Candidatus Paceibacterota bacterium]|jgi:hypothetical protein